MEFTLLLDALKVKGGTMSLPPRPWTLNMTLAQRPFHLKRSEHYADLSTDGEKLSNGCWDDVSFTSNYSNPFVLTVEGGKNEEWWS